MHFNSLTDRQEKQIPIDQQLRQTLQTVANMRQALPDIDPCKLTRLEGELQGLRDGSIESRRIIAGSALLNLLQHHDDPLIFPDVLKQLHLDLRKEERIKS